MDISSTILSLSLKKEGGREMAFTIRPRKHKQKEEGKDITSTILSLRLKKGRNVASTIIPLRLKSEGGRGVTILILLGVVLPHAVKIERGRWRSFPIITRL